MARRIKLHLVLMGFLLAEAYNANLKDRLATEFKDYGFETPKEVLEEIEAEKDDFKIHDSLETMTIVTESPPITTYCH